MAAITELMHGPQFAKSYVSDYLQSDIPLRIIDYQNEWQADGTELPTPIKYLTYEPIALDTWPTIITVAISTNKFDLIDYNATDPIYRVTYSLRTYVWVRADGSEEVTIMRDRLTTVVRTALLDYPSMRSTDDRVSWLAKMDENSLREEFSDLTLLKGDRVLAGAYLSYDFTIDEIVRRRTIGTIEEIDMKVKLTGGPNSALSLDA